MASKIKVKIKRARDLPITDRNQSSDASTDAFVEVRIEEQEQHTQIIKKSLNPQWNEEFTFEFVDDAELQTAPIEIKVLDKDNYSAEVIGVVYIDLNPLFMETAYSSDSDDFSIGGWYHLFDTVYGLRGMIEVSVKLYYIGNATSAGIHFFSSSSLSTNAFVVKEYYGFVEDMVVEDDPESNWRDYFRKATKASHYQRWKSLMDLSTLVRSEIARKVFEAGGNAVLGYKVNFDMPSPTAIVARACGTACRLYKVDDESSISPAAAYNTVVNSTEEAASHMSLSDCALRLFSRRRTGGYLGGANAGNGNHHTAAMLGGVFDISELIADSNESALACVLRDTSLGRSKVAGTLGSGEREEAGNMAPDVIDNMDLPTYMHINGADGSCSQISLLKAFGPPERQGLHCDISGSSNVGGIIRSNPTTRLLGPGGGDGEDGGGNTTTGDAAMYAGTRPDVTLFTVKSFPTHIRIRIGGLVSARSVKYLGKLDHTVAGIEQKTQEVWWEELRDEIKNHARTLCCTHIIGYHEYCTIFGDVCILSAVGTGAVIRDSAYPLLPLKAINQHALSSDLSDLLLASGNDLVSSIKRKTEIEQAMSSSSPSGGKGSSGDVDGTEAPLDIDGISLETHNNEVGPELSPMSNSVAVSRQSSAGGTSSRKKSAADGVALSENAAAGHHLLHGGTFRITVAPHPRKYRAPKIHSVRPCTSMHVPYNHRNGPFNFMRLVPCLCCARKWVPECMLSTTDPNPQLPIRGKGEFLEVRVCKSKKAVTGEAQAANISGLLPFLEFDIQRQVMY